MVAVRCWLVGGREERTGGGVSIWVRAHAGGAWRESRFGAGGFQRMDMGRLGRPRRDPRRRDGTVVGIAEMIRRTENRAATARVPTGSLP